MVSDFSFSQMPANRTFPHLQPAIPNCTRATVNCL